MVSPSRDGVEGLWPGRRRDACRHDGMAGGLGDTTKRSLPQRQRS